jgi:ribosome-associated translation inhibitor RaiA
MRLFLQHAHLRSTDHLDRWVEQTLFGLHSLVRIDEAHVRLEYRADASPAYRASAHLVVPGPDLRAEAVDHTVRTAFAKVLAQLKASATDRAARRRHRVPSDRHLRAAFAFASFARR